MQHMMKPNGALRDRYILKGHGLVSGVLETLGPPTPLNPDCLSISQSSPSTSTLDLKIPVMWVVDQWRGPSSLGAHQTFAFTTMDSYNNPALPNKKPKLNAIF